MQKEKTSGRSMIEMLGILALMGMIAITGLYFFKQATISSKSKTIAKDISSALTERRYQNALGGVIKEHKLTLTVGSTPMTVRNKEVEDKKQISILLPSISQDLCEELKKFNLFTPNKVEIGHTIVDDRLTDGVQNGTCKQENALEFFFDPTEEAQGGGALQNSCDGIMCGKCETCVAGTCQKDTTKNGKQVNECGICKNGIVIKDTSKNTDCRICDDDFMFDLKSPGETCGLRPCHVCNEDGLCEQTGDECNGGCCSEGEHCSHNKCCPTDQEACGDECCPNGCNTTGTACAKTCDSECGICEECDIDEGICKLSPHTQVCGENCCADDVECCDGECCDAGEICEGGVCQASPGECTKDSQCAANTVAKFCDKKTHTCVECVQDKHCGDFYIYDDERGCRDNKCVYEPCNVGTCQICEVQQIVWDDENKHWKPVVKHSFKPNGEECVQSGASGTCDGFGICHPNGTSCNSVSGCPANQFCNYGGTYDSGAMQHGRRGKTPNICEPVRAQQFTVTDENGNTITYYYPYREDLRSWCRAADEGQNCSWGYLAYPGAQSWCYGINKRLLTSDEFKTILTASDYIDEIETLETFSKKYSDLNELRTFIQNIQYQMQSLDDTEKSLKFIINQDDLLEELATNCETLSCLKTQLNDVLNLTQGYTDFEELQKHVFTLQQYFQLHRKLAKGVSWSMSNTAGSYWIQGGSYTGGKPYAGRPDGYWGMGSVICRDK